MCAVSTACTAVSLCACRCIYACVLVSSCACVLCSWWLQVFVPGVSQEQVFEDTKHLVQSAVDGFNVCIFAYGQVREACMMNETLNEYRLQQRDMHYSRGCAGIEAGLFSLYEFTDLTPVPLMVPHHVIFYLLDGTV